ncbi:stage II sporulation protein M [Deltaproteobacteria bacterium OttesenSCG-928-M10]|nr:stage II sporulation protein M [Deltaproteobacteria bacterium OttesenSCG-928-M10]
MSENMAPPTRADQAGRPVPHLGPAERQAAEIVLRSAEFRRGRESGWRQLDELVTRIEKNGVSSLSADEAQRLPLLYRAAMSSLSVARSIVLDRNLLLYLENLSLRAYLAVYGPRVGVMFCLRRFFREGFPQAVRNMRWHLAIVLAVLLVGAIAGFLLVQNDPSYFHLFIPEDLAGGRGPESTAEELRKTELFAPWPGFVETFVVFANTLFQHNTMVGIFAFGLGFALGIPTLFLVLYNGLVIGAFLAIHARVGLLVDSLAWLSIHGVTEILAILLCGAAGLVVGEKILFPGRLPRLESLAKYGREAAGVAAGAVALFFIAGFLEGGFRQLINNTPGRFAFALLTAAWWLYYFTLMGKAMGKPEGKAKDDGSDY